jgi:hypothetical protein
LRLRYRKERGERRREKGERRGQKRERSNLTMKQFNNETI